MTRPWIIRSSAPQDLPASWFLNPAVALEDLESRLPRQVEVPAGYYEAKLAWLTLSPPPPVDVRLVVAAILGPASCKALVRDPAEGAAFIRRYAGLVQAGGDGT